MFADWVKCGGGRSIAIKGLLRGQRTVRRMTLLLRLGGI